MKFDISKAFEQIYKDQSDSIFRFCLVRVSNREQALDISQETFLRLWKNLMENKDILNCRAFLFKVANNLIIDWYRKKKSFSLDQMIGDDIDVKYDVPDESNKDTILCGAEGRYLLERINDLDPTHRQPVYLRFVEGLSPPEIGDILGISANTASVRVSRGLIELRKKTGYDDKNENKS
jgi:RNA polymerase sigma-70 factor (ECF subfamily)